MHFRLMSYYVLTYYVDEHMRPQPHPDPTPAECVGLVVLAAATLAMVLAMTAAFAAVAAYYGLLALALCAGAA
jgi:hypothetical protein